VALPKLQILALCVFEFGKGENNLHKTTRFLCTYCDIA